MSKKPPKAERPAPASPAELMLASLVFEREWTYTQRIVHALPWTAIRSAALRPIDAGGIGRNYGIATLKGLVAQHRADQGEVVGTREERIERRQLELDTLALLARASLEKAASLGALDVHAADVLLKTRTAEAKMHGDDAALRIEADVTTHDAVTDELNEMLARIGEAPIGAES